MKLRAMRKADWPAVAELIYVSTNYWYESNGRDAIFKGGPQVAELFCEVYEDLDPGCCILAEEPKTKRLMGSCFYHPRETHVSLGIMNVSPAWFGRGVARELLDFILAFARKEKKPARLVSSAMNLDSFSLYTRAGFVARQAYQDLYLSVPAAGLKFNHPGLRHIRPARLADVDALVALEEELCGLRRGKDFRYFIQNRRGIWHMSVYEENGRIEGALASVQHPGSNMLGPGFARECSVAAALILAELDRHRGRTPVFLAPVHEGALIQQVYAWGARNCEIHFAQVLGDCAPFRGVTLPTFMPETA